MKRKKKKIGFWIFIWSIVLIVVYAAYSILMMLQVQKVIRSSVDSYGQAYTVYEQSVLDEEVYRALSLDRTQSADEYQYTVSPVLHWFVGGVMTCRYSYVSYDEQGNVVKSIPNGELKIDIGLRDFLWCIKEVEIVT